VYKLEKLKPKRKNKFKYFLLAHILTLFFVVGNFSFAADLPAEEAGDNSYFGQKNTYSEPFSKLVEFLNDKKKELGNYDESFGGVKFFLRKNSSNLSADEAGGIKFASESDFINSSFLSATFESVKSFINDKPKQYFSNILDSAKGFIFSKDSQNSFEYEAPTREENAKEIENLKQQYDEAISQAGALNQKFILLKSETEKIKNSGALVMQPTAGEKDVENTIKILEMIVSGLPDGQTGAPGLPQGELDSKISEIRTELNNLNTNLTNRINNLSSDTNRQTASAFQSISLTNRIDNLSGTRLTNITVSGVTGLADADIPDGITASNYLLLTGGTLSGSLTGTSASFSSTLTVTASTTFNGIEYKWPSSDGTANQALVTNGAGGLSWTTISGGSGSGVPDWNKQTNYGVLTLTASTTIPYWAKDAFYASSTSVFQGLATFGNASTSQISATNSYLGTVLSGTWNGTAISNQYGGTGLDSSALTGLAQIVSGTWSASSTLSTAYGGTGWNSIQTNTLLLGNGAGRIATTTSGTDGYVLALSAGVPTWLATSTLSTITGTLTVGKGGTGQTSFGQGWLHSDGTTLTSSTSPTVNYIVATSTTNNSTFAGNIGIGTTSPYAKLSVSGDTALDSMFVNFASSSAPSLTLNYLKSATSTIPSNTNYAWSIATSTSASPIFSISTLGSGSNLNATTTINGGLNLDNGAILYDYSSGITTINSLEAGPMNFDNDAGIITAFDLPIVSASAGTVESYSFNIAASSTPNLTVYGESNGSAGVQNQRIGIGTTTPWRTLSVNGTAALQNITVAVGAGSLCRSSSNEVTYNAADTCLSSLRSTKHNIENLTVSGLDIINALQPVSFVYNEEYGDDRIRYGFIADDAAIVDEHFATFNGAVMSGIDDRAILSVAVKAIKELNLKVIDLEASVASTEPSSGLFSWFVSKFAEVFGIIFEKDTIKAKNICVGETCVTEEQFKTVFANSQSSSVSSSSLSSVISSSSSSSSSVAASSSVTSVGNDGSSSSLSSSSESSSSSITSSESSQPAISSSSSAASQSSSLPNEQASSAASTSSDLSSSSEASLPAGEADAASSLSPGSSSEQSSASSSEGASE